MIRELDIKSASFHHIENTLTLQEVGEDDSYLYLDAGGLYILGSQDDTILDGTLIKGPGEVKIGIDGAGGFTQYGGEFQFSGAMYLGDQIGGVGTYTMTDGSIVEGPDGLGGIVLGEWGGTGYFDQSGGSVTIGDLTLGRQASEGNTGIDAFKGAGTYTLSGDESSLNVAGAITVGMEGVGIFDQSGGSVTAGSLTVGGEGVDEDNDDSPIYGTGTYNLSGGALRVLGNEIIGQGAGSFGTFNQSGGEHNVEGDLYVDMQASSKGVYNLSHGFLNVGLKDDGQDLADGTGNLIVGSFGTAEFNQGPSVLSGEGFDGGTNTVLGDLIIGRDASSSGTYNLSGGVLNVDNVMWNEDPPYTTHWGKTYVGHTGTGVFNLSGGTHNAWEVLVGYIGTGTYEIYDGELNAWQIVVGGKYDSGSDSGVGSILQYGGTVNTGHLHLADTSSSSGEYTMYGGDLNVGGYDVIGAAGTAVFTQTGGTHTAESDLVLGTGEGSHGTYTISEADSAPVLDVEGALIVGEGGTGTFNLEGGSVEAGQLFVGNSASGIGKFTQTGGELRVGVTRNAGFELEVMGGLHELIIGRSPGSQGSYDMSGGAMLIKREIVGDDGSSVASFSQTGGKHTIFEDLIIGQDFIEGAYDLSGAAYVEVKGRAFLGDMGGTGSMTVSQGAAFYVVNDEFAVGANSEEADAGHTSVGTVLQTDGLVEAQTLTLGKHAETTGNYLLESGDLVTSHSQIGEAGSGNFLQTGGTHTATSLQVGPNGVYDFSGGFLNVGTKEIVGKIDNYGIFKGGGSEAVNVGTFTNFGTLAPGNSPGALNIAGNFIQDSDGILEIELGESLFDVLNITGTATLAGKIEISLWKEFIPDVGSTFNFLMAAGGFTEGSAFSSILGPSGWKWDVAYIDVDVNGIAHTAQLTASAVPIPGAALLLGPALLGLAGLRRRSQA